MDDELVNQAIDAMRRAYAPYSGFSVGAAVRARSGRIYQGCNVENAAYPLGNCAEASAIAAMITGGETELTAIAVAGDGEQLCTPCGGCRQRIAEFADPQIPVHIAGPGGYRATFELAALLPHGFGKANLE